MSMRSLVLLTTLITFCMSSLVYVDLVQANDNGSNEQTFFFDIPPQSLDAALQQIAEISGTHVIHEADIVGEKRSKPLRNRYSVTQALDKTLESTGLTYRYAANNTVAVMTIAQATREENPILLVESQVRGREQIQGHENVGGVMPETVEFEPTTIEAVLEGTLSESYGATDSFATTRTDTLLIKTPQSAQSITRQAIGDAGADTLADTYEYLSSVTRDNTQGGLQGDEYIVRGFETDNILFNGNRTSSASTLDLQNVERVEVLRGPTSALFGKGDPGGLINVITKQPLDDPYREIDLSGATGLGGDGSDLRKGRLGLDLGGPITEDGRLRYRFNVAYDREDSYRNDVEEEIIFISPVIDYQFSENTIINVELISQDRQDTFDRGLFLINGDSVLDRDFNISTGDTGEIDKDFLSGTIRLEHTFNSAWKLRLGLYGSDDERKGDAVQQGSITGSMFTRQRRFVDSVDKFLTFQPELVGELETGPIKHTLLFGADLARQEIDFFGEAGPDSAPIDALNPDFSIPIPEIGSGPGGFLFDSKLDSEAYSAYVQDQIEISEQWNVLLGLRYEVVELDGDLTAAFGPLALNPKDSLQDSDLTSRFGVVFNPTTQWGIYGSYGESFRFPVDTLQLSTAAGEEVKPETGKNYEIGVKYESENGQWGGTFALYRIDKENVLETDPNDPFGFLTADNLGKVRSEGVEFDLSGELTDSLSISLSYAYTDARIAKDTPNFRDGTRLRNIPEHSAAMQLAYRFSDKLRVFGGVVYEDARRTDTSDTVNIEIPSFVRFDLGADYYVTPDIQLTLLVKNLTDEEYFTSAAGQFNLGVGDPLRVDFGLKVVF